MHHCNLKGVVSRITCEKALKAFFPEPCVMLTQKLAGATHQEKLSILVKAAWRYNVLFPRPRKLQTHRHTRNSAINIIDIFRFHLLRLLSVFFVISCLSIFTYQLTVTCLSFFLDVALTQHITNTSCPIFVPTHTSFSLGSKQIQLLFLSAFLTACLSSTRLCFNIFQSSALIHVLYVMLNTTPLVLLGSVAVLTIV